MKKYTVYFELCGKKMRKMVFAAGEENAKRIIKDSLKIVAVKQGEGTPAVKDSTAQMLKDYISNMMKKIWP
jgi:hypothetical protein